MEKARILAELLRFASSLPAGSSFPLFDENQAARLQTSTLMPCIVEFISRIRSLFDHKLPLQTNLLIARFLEASLDNPKPAVIVLHLENSEQTRNLKTYFKSVFPQFHWLDFSEYRGTFDNESADEALIISNNLQFLQSLNAGSQKKPAVLFFDSLAIIEKACLLLESGLSLSRIPLFLDQSDSRESRSLLHLPPHGGKVMVCLNLPGTRLGENIRNYLHRNLKETDLEFLVMEVWNPDQFALQLGRISRNSLIVCICGLQDPGIHGIPFLSLDTLLKCPADKLPLLLARPDFTAFSHVRSRHLYAFVEHEMSLDQETLKDIMPGIFSTLQTLHPDIPASSWNLLFLQLCALAEACLDTNPACFQRQDSLPASLETLAQTLLPMEKAFRIHFAPNQLSEIQAFLEYAEKNSV